MENLHSVARMYGRRISAEYNTRQKAAAGTDDSNSYPAVDPAFGIPVQVLINRLDLVKAMVATGDTGPSLRFLSSADLYNEMKPHIESFLT